MRGIEALLLVGFLGLVGVGVWNARQWLPDWGVKAVGSGSSAASKVAGEIPRAGDTKGRDHGKGSHMSGGRQQVAIASMDVAPASETIVDVPAPGFPLRKDLRIGATGGEIRGQYGEPTACITEMRGGHVLEHYYYFNSERTRLTVATFESGVLASAETTPP